MKVNENNSGYTLLELMITILIGSIITLATTTILLLGLRLNNESTDTVEKQNTARILLSSLEDLATEGSLGKICYMTDTWQIWNKENSKIIYYYDAASKTIYTGEDTPLLEDVIASHVMLDTNKVLTFSVETDKGTYSSSVYYRMASNDAFDSEQIQEDVSNQSIRIDDGSNTSVARTAFLKILASQYGSTGYIKPYTYSNEETNPDITIEIKADTLEYYVQKYNKDWELDTPWCAIFLSWTLEQIEGKYIETSLSESHVSKFEAHFRSEIDGSQWKEPDTYSNPIPGDIIFFDWDPGKQNGYDHVGVVLKVETKTINEETKKIVYTIEGNTANMVAVRGYYIDDPDIVGYGVLNWETNTELGVTPAAENK